MRTDRVTSTLRDAGVYESRHAYESDPDVPTARDLVAEYAPPDPELEAVVAGLSRAVDREAARCNAAWAAGAAARDAARVRSAEAVRREVEARRGGGPRW